MDRLKRSIKRKLSAIICTRCGLAGHSDRDQRCPQWDAKEIQTFPPLTGQCYAELTNLLSCYKDEITLTDDDYQWRKRICKMIEDLIRPLYPNAQLVLFGSSANGFGSIHSDLDISMKLPGATGHKIQASIVRSLMKQLKRHSSRERWNQGDIKCIPWAKVPIVKMKLSHKWNNLECDISVGNYMALDNTEMLSAYARIDERVQTLGVALKQFAKSNDMCDASTGSLSSYAYILLLLHYLQQVKPPVIPVLQQVGAPGVKMIDGCNCWFYRFDSLYQLSSVWPHVRRNQSSVGELWVSFFKYYTEEFDWSRRVVTVRRLEPLSKLEKSWRNKSACIEDPFNLSRNLAGHLSDPMWAYIQEVLGNGRNRFCNPAFYRTPITCERVFDNCGDVEDLPVKSIKGTIRNSTNYNELPAAATGKRRHQATIHHDNAVIFIDDTDEEDDEKFVAKKPRVVSYGSTMSKDTQRHVQYSSPPLKHSSSSNPVPVNATSWTPEYHKAPLLHKQEQKPSQQQQQVSRYYSVDRKPLLSYPVHASKPPYGNDSTLGPHFNHSNSPYLLESAPQSAHNNSYTNAPATSRTPSGMNFRSETVTTHDHSYKTTEQSHRQAPWLNRSRPDHDHDYAMPQISSRRQDDHYSRRSSLDQFPTSSVAYRQASPRLSNPQVMLEHSGRNYDRSSGVASSSYSTTSSSRSSGYHSNNWSSPSGSSSVTDRWRLSDSTHNDNAGNKVSDLFPLMYANSVLSSYSSSHQDKSHSDYHYGNSH